MLHRRHRGGHVVGGVRDRVGEVARDERVDAVVEGRREEEALPPGRQEVEDRADLGKEPHVGHVVRLVEDDRLDGGEVDRPALDEVREPPRRGDEEVDTPGQGTDLGVVGQPTCDEDVAQADDVDERGQRVPYLHGELAGRHEHEGARPPRARTPAVEEAGQRRQAEGQGLTRPRSAPAQDVATGQGIGDGRRLDGERLRDAVRGQPLDEPSGNAERGEAAGPTTRLAAWGDRHLTARGHGHLATPLDGRLAVHRLRATTLLRAPVPCGSPLGPGGPGRRLRGPGRPLAGPRPNRPLAGRRPSRPLAGRRPSRPLAGRGAGTPGLGPPGDGAGALGLRLAGGAPPRLLRRLA